MNSGLNEHKEIRNMIIKNWIVGIEVEEKQKKRKKEVKGFSSFINPV